MIHTNDHKDLCIEQKCFHIDYIHNTTITKNISINKNAELFYLIICQEAECNITIQTLSTEAKSHIFAICPSKDNKQCKLTITSKLIHSSTESEVYILSLAGDKADIEIDGGIYIGPGITKPVGHLTEKNIVLGQETKVHTLPLLDVHSNDVQASHGASISKLSPQQLFYLRSKGLSKQQSTHLMVIGYIEDILGNFNQGASPHQLAEIKQAVSEYILGK